MTIVSPYGWRSWPRRRGSPRQFTRAFRAETGESPARAVETLRVEAARLMLEQSRHPVDVVAQQTAFADRERMRRAFLRAFGKPPLAIRRNARAPVTASGAASVDRASSVPRAPPKTITRTRRRLIWPQMSRNEASTTLGIGKSGLSLT